MISYGLQCKQQSSDLRAGGSGGPRGDSTETRLGRLPSADLRKEMNASTTELRQEIARSHLVLVESIATARTWGLMLYIVLGGALLGTMAAGFGWLK
jgi:hypothetical protein